MIFPLSDIIFFKLGTADEYTSADRTLVKAPL